MHVILCGELEQEEKENALSTGYIRYEYHYIGLICWLQTNTILDIYAIIMCMHLTLLSTFTLNTIYALPLKLE